MKRIISTALAAVVTGGLLTIAAPAQADRPMFGANQPACVSDKRTKAKVVVIPQARRPKKGLRAVRVVIRVTRKLDGETKIRHRVRRLATAKVIRVRMQPGERVRVEVVRNGRLFGGLAVSRLKALKRCG